MHPFEFSARNRRSPISSSSRGNGAACLSDSGVAPVELAGGGAAPEFGAAGDRVSAARRNCSGDAGLGLSAGRARGDVGALSAASWAVGVAAPSGVSASSPEDPFGAPPAGSSASPTCWPSAVPFAWPSAVTELPHHVR